MSLLGLREFAHMRWDPLALIVDARESSSARLTPLDNPFFSWVRITEGSQIRVLASEISQRHLIVVHEDEEYALDLDHVFKTLEIYSMALEGGERGWQEAVIEESAQMHGDALIVTMNQLAYNRRQYLVIHDGRAIAVQPSGSVAAIREEARHYGARIEAVVDVFRDTTSAQWLADVVHAPYYRANSLDASGKVLDVCGMRLCRTAADSLNISLEACSIGLPLHQSHTDPRSAVRPEK